MTEEQIQDIASVCNSFPDLEVAAELLIESVSPEDEVDLVITVSQDETDSSPIHAPRYPQVKAQSHWWILVGDQQDNKIYALKFVTFDASETKVALKFIAPANPGVYNLTVYTISDSFIGFDDMVDLSLEVSN